MDGLTVVWPCACEITGPLGLVATHGGIGWIGDVVTLHETTLVDTAHFTRDDRLPVATAVALDVPSFRHVGAAGRVGLGGEYVGVRALWLEFDASGRSRYYAGVSAGRRVAY